ncbi:MAG: IS66 family transposase zinc-finger binding domain-containing protein [Alphaproteobacteria bacterium]|nr:IS66 family transposase zinc-finger binding domain-containing protein [Alphaproteobacteria bacterium]
MAKLGDDVAEVLDDIPGRIRMIRHVPPIFACRHCDEITQAAAPALPTPRGRATPGMLAHLLVSKYADHLPLDLERLGRPGDLAAAADRDHHNPEGVNTASLKLRSGAMRAKRSVLQPPTARSARAIVPAPALQKERVRNPGDRAIRG